ncbi:S-adenosyl-L-methionine-dependent methyltransferase [Gigaspora margarita]|uniref:S-adenosyl-L-methionine-dependent methyltransferase n=1 Tax=Gigaspora margarita TaxID=4874 RepID=A0A8H4APN8_GIGMA|nr:S-adenosyl-L-methionine-dependent methyltransferase [Gigaspora margarita]
MVCLSSKLSEKGDTINSQNTQTEFRYVDGRRFHNLKSAVYSLPNDDDESDRLHMQHFLIRYIWQNNFSAPIEHILNDPNTKILDVGYPLINVFGLDISPNQAVTIKPKNFTFIKANVLEGIPFEDDTFDYVFQRYLLGGYTKEKWPDAINEIVRVLKPGGFLEIMEPSMLHNVGPATNRLCETGQLENIREEIRECRHGTNSSDADLKFSKAAIDNLIDLYSCWKPFLSKLMQISSEEYDELIKISEKELFEYDTYFYQVRVYANKIVNSNNE